MVPATMKKTTRKYVWSLAANALLLLVVIAVWQYRLHTPGRDPDAQYLPDATYLADLQDQASLADLRGQWVLLNLWASWCPGCIVEMPSLEKLAKEYKSKGLYVIAISLDEAETPDNVQDSITKFKFGDIARNWDDKGQVYAKFNPPGLPMTYLADPSGKIIQTFAGERDWSDPQVRALIDQSLDVSSGTTVNKSPTSP